MTFEGSSSRRRRLGGDRDDGMKGGKDDKDADDHKREPRDSTLKSWDTEQLVKVYSTAASSTRPVCPQGQRTCEELGDRWETIAHLMSSDDPLWNGLSSPKVNLTVSVVYDTADPPAVSNSRFVDTLNAIEVMFSGATNRGGQNRDFDCSKVLDMGRLPRGALGTKGASCSWKSPDTLLITLGSKASVVPGDTMALLQASIKASALGSSLYLTNSEVPVGNPRTGTEVAVVLSGPSKHGVCDDVKLDGSMTTGSGGRPLSYVFSSVSKALANSSSSFFGSANNAAGGNGVHSIVLPSTALPVSSYEVTLTATNFLGASGSKTIHIQKLGVPAPLLSFQESSPKVVTRSDELALRVEARLPDLGCDLAGQTGSSGSQMVYSFAEITGQFVGGFVGVHPRILRVPKDVLVPGKTYQFLANVWMANNRAVNSSTVIDVVVVAQDLVARIEGGKERVVGVDTSFNVDSSTSYDPDQDANDHLTFSWLCLNATSGNAVALEMPSTSALSVPALALVPGSFVFRVTVANPFSSQEDATASVTIHVTAGNPPRVSVASLGKLKYNANDKFVRLTGSVETTGAKIQDTSWSVEDGDVDAETVMLPSATGSHHAQAVVDLSVLTAGSTYVFRLSATTSWGSSSFAQVELTMNRPPSSGSLEVSPGAGYTFDTDFEFVSLNWVDEDLPLYYKFSFDADGVGDQVTPLGDYQSSAMYSNALLPQGRKDANYTVVGMVSVIDTYGAVGWTQSPLRVLPLTLSTAALANRSRALAQASIEAGDPDGCMQVISATLRSLKNSDSDVARRRRQLLALSSSSALESSLYYVEEAYSMSDLSDSSVESLLSNLADVASLVTDASFTVDIAWETLRILRIPLHALRSDDSALSATAASSAVSIISDLLISPLFNGTASESVATGSFSTGFGGRTASKNVSLALTEMTSSLLCGAYDGIGYTSSASRVLTYSYRSEVQYLAGASVLLPPSEVGVTFPSDFSLGDGVDGSDLMDVRVSLLDVNIHGFYSLGFSAGAHLSAASPLLQTELLLGSTESKIAVEGLGMPLLITLNTTETLDVVDSGAWTRTGECPASSASASPIALQFECPHGSVAHTCAFGNGHTVTVQCPGIVPKCLLWKDGDMGGFHGQWVHEDGVCRVQNYTTTQVTCSCSQLGDIIVATNISAAVVSLQYTSAPSQSPTLAPEPLPSALPISAPSAKPLPAPTQAPSHEPTATSASSFPAPVPTSAPSPGPAPVSAPSGAPIQLPTTAPSRESVPVSTPTASPVPGPVSGPTAAPAPASTLAPSVKPTASDSIVLSTSMTMMAESSSTSEQEIALKSTIASEMGIGEDAITSFRVAVSPATTRRRHLFATTTYAWLIDMEITSTLSELGYSNAESVSSGVASTLSASSFENAVQDMLNIAVSVDSSSISTTLTRVRTLKPVSSPTQKTPGTSTPADTTALPEEPSGAPTAAPTIGSKSNAATASMQPILIGLAALFATSGLLFTAVRRQTLKRRRGVVMAELSAEVKDAKGAVEVSQIASARTPWDAFQNSDRGRDIENDLRMTVPQPSDANPSPRKRNASPRIASEVSEATARYGLNGAARVSPRDEGNVRDSRSRDSGRSKTGKVEVRPRHLPSISAPSTSDDANQRLKYHHSRNVSGDDRRKKRAPVSPSAARSGFPMSP